MQRRAPKHCTGYWLPMMAGMRCAMKYVAAADLPALLLKPNVS